MENNKIKFGRVALLGRPNTGKSTLINTLLGQKGAITSPLPQTTRKNRDYWLKDEEGNIMVLVDTPGLIGKIDDTLGKKINQMPGAALKGVDVIVGIYDISREKNDEDNKITGMLRKQKHKVILFFNKIDKGDKTVKHKQEYDFLGEEFEVMTGSALTGLGVKPLIKKVWDMLPEVDTSEIEDHDWSKLQSPGDTAKEFVAEIIREKSYLGLREELPYTTTVEVESIVDKNKIVVIKAQLLTNNERYKKMIIGKGGKKIKEIGATARKELEIATGRKIFLDLTVSVDRHWQEREIFDI
ncbi:MAG: GTPase Era [Candidatus Shapirobacteria bacterium]